MTPHFNLESSRAATVLKEVPAGQESTGSPAARRSSAPVQAALIGCGKRGVRLATAIRDNRLMQILAVADPYQGRLERGREILGGDLHVETDYRPLLEREEIDAVLVATPDHLHAPVIRQSVEAGKHVYCEAPLSHRATEVEEIRRAVENGRSVFQSGSARITSPLYRKAKAIVSSGVLGRITLVSASWHTNTALHAWKDPFPPDASPETVDFGAFSAGTSTTGFDLDRFFCWPRYREYSAGLAGFRFCHQLSALHYLMEAPLPTRVWASGQILRWKDGRDIPDLLQAVCEYPGFTVSLLASQNAAGPGGLLEILGTEGTLTVMDRSLHLDPEPTVEPYVELAESWPERYRNWFYMMHGLGRNGKVRRQTPRVDMDREEYVLPASFDPEETHLRDFRDAIILGTQPQESIRSGHQAAVVTAMINQSDRWQKPVSWDNRTRSVRQA
jgi:predicted dehydrogenase